MRRKNTTWCATAFVALSAVALAGSGERICNSSGAEEDELWTGPFPIAWEIVEAQIPASAGFPTIGKDTNYFMGSSNWFISQLTYPGYPSNQCAIDHFNHQQPIPIHPHPLNDSNAFIRKGKGKAESLPGFQSVVRAIEAWNDAAVAATASGTPTVGASTFSFAEPWDDPTTTKFAVVPADLSGNPNFASNDGRNTISFIDRAFVPASTLELARTFVFTPAGCSSAVIGDFDMLFNRSIPWIEMNDKLGTTFSSISGGSAVAADLQGVITHELGHAIGVAHSLVDSEALFDTATLLGDSDFPTMFPFAQNSLLSGTANDPSYFDPTCDTFAQFAPFPITGMTMLGASARDLEADDTATLGAMYPSAAYSTQLGTIEGTVLFEPANAPGTSVPAKGAHVVAIDLDDPDRNRVGTLSIELDTVANVNYRISGLRPGSYYVMVEPVDDDLTDMDNYFPNDVLPNYVLPLGSCGCPGIVSRFPREFFDASEAFNETLWPAATSIAVAAGAATRADLLVKELPVALPPGGLTGPQLRIGVSPLGTASIDAGSRRGFAASSLWGPPPNVDVILDTPPAQAVVLLVGPVLDFTTFPAPTGQQIGLQFPAPVALAMFDITAPPAPGMSTQWLLPIPSTAIATAQYQNVFLQAIVVKANGSTALSNPVNLWVFE